MAEHKCEPVAYLYHDASVPEDAHPWLHSTMLVMAADRRPGLRGETPLHTAAQLAEEVERARAEERRRAAMAVWIKRQEFEANPDDDGVIHWLMEAERAIRTADDGAQHG